MIVEFLYFCLAVILVVIIGFCRISFCHEESKLKKKINDRKKKNITKYW